jgi:hypothetical protein
VNISLPSQWQEVTKNSPCRACGKPDWCRESADGAIACRRCNDDSGLSLLDKNGDPYVFVRPENAGADYQLPAFEVKATASPVCLSLRDRAYQRICNELTLEKNHVANLQKRGLTEAAIQFHGFYSGPIDRNHRQSIARGIVRMLPNDWQNVPGLYAESDGEPNLGGNQGIWIPVRNLQSQIQAIKIRKDVADKGQSRYRTLSSTRHGGPGPGQVCSAWLPSSGTPVPEQIRVCEGELKACVAAEKTSVESFAAPGVGALASPTILDWIHAKKPARVLFAPDQDAFTNRSVQEQTIRALETYLADAQSQSYEVLVETWEGPNGIDDALVAEAEIKLEAGADYLGRLRNHSQTPVSVEKEKPGELPLLEQALLGLAALCDGAHAKDSRGFSKADREWFAPHLASVKLGHAIAVRVRNRCFERLAKYGRQLFEAGFNINDLARSEALIRQASKAEFEEDGLTQTDKLLALASDELEIRLIKNSGQVYGVVSVVLENGGKRKECHRFGREGIRLQLLRAYRRKYNSVPSSEALTSATEALKADATIDGLEETVWIRTAQHDNKLYLDMANPQGEVVEVSAGSWKIIKDPPVNFIRPHGLMAIPTPTPGSSLLELRPYVNLDETGWRIVASWLLFSLFPLRPHPVLLLEGEQGSSKSCLARLLRSIVDPVASPLRKMAKSAEDAAVMAGANWIFCLDNLATIPPWLSDFLCGLATGSGSSQRKLFTDDDEHTINYLRPVLVTGIGGLNGKADLGDRVMKVTLKPIDGKLRMDEETFDRQTAEIRPRILGALLDIASVALKNKGKIPVPPLPRLADFSKTIIEAEEALPWERGDFLDAFNEARQEQIEAAIEDDDLAQAIRDLALCHRNWEGSATQLVERLCKLKGSKGIPSAHKLQVNLRLLSPYLRAVGVAVVFLKTNGRRLVKVSMLSNEPALAQPQEISAPTITAKPLQECILSGLMDYRPQTARAQNGSHTVAQEPAVVAAH